ncbi:MAG: methyltransferase domain-containing protein [Candidatus Polarisedimenticolaceae bacterium]|nr:methyltransferase domain-containing protein [Candidatus Polarisedimenticolaceae bacterium]
MRLSHFEALQPLCPHCRHQRNQDHLLRLAEVFTERDEQIIEGVLHCSDPTCNLEYPIIGGIPLILPDVRSYINDNIYHLTARHDLSESIESIIADAIGPQTHYDITRQHLSTYGWDGYADLDPDEAEQSPQPGAVKRCLEQGIDLLEHEITPPVIDLGCAVGRSTFELAERYDGPVLGIDISFSMLQMAQRILQDGVVSYPRRRVGIVYDRRRFEVNFTAAQHVDFWACDAQALPFAANSFGLVSALQLIDSTPTPLQLLHSISQTLRPGGSAIIATPYDWSAQVTPIEAWVGGHSQRGPMRGAAEPLLRSLLTPGAHPQSIAGLRLKQEIESLPWHTRINERSTTQYDVHLIVAEAFESEPS